jgi:predicted nucleic acid-binding protein
MILYVDTSALVKKYIREAESDAFLSFISGFTTIGTAWITQVEMSAAMSKAVCLSWIDRASIDVAWQDFQLHWMAYVRLPFSAAMSERAVGMTWRHDLRANDAIHLASALTWQELMLEKTAFACFDKRLSQAARLEGLATWPE